LRQNNDLLRILTKYGIQSHIQSQQSQKKTHKSHTGIHVLNIKY
jgi:hypothetical protein